MNIHKRFEKYIKIWNKTLEDTNNELSSLRLSRLQRENGGILRKRDNYIDRVSLLPK